MCSMWSLVVIDFGSVEWIGEGYGTERKGVKGDEDGLNQIDFGTAGDCLLIEHRLNAVRSVLQSYWQRELGGMRKDGFIARAVAMMYSSNLNRRILFVFFTDRTVL